MVPPGSGQKENQQVHANIVAHAPLNWGMLFLLLFVMVMIARIQDVIPVLSGWRVGLLTGGLASLFWVLAPGSLQEKASLDIKQVRSILMLLGLAAVTIPVGVWPGQSFEYLTGSYVKIVVAFLLVLFWCHTLQDVRRILWTCCLGLAVLVLYGMASGQEIAGRLQADAHMYDPNDTALILAAALPLALYLFATSGYLLRLLLTGVLFLYLYGNVLTRSRGGFLALLTVCLLVLWRSTLSRSSKTIIVLLATLVLGGFASEEYWDRIKTIWNAETEYDRTAGARTLVWRNGLMILLSNPWGIGIGGFTIAEGLSHQGQGTWHAAHNMFLQVGVELGIVGLGVFVLLLTHTLRELRRLQLRPVASGPQGRLQEDLAPVAAALEASLWGYLAGGLFLSQAYSGLLYVLIALSAVCTRIARTGSPTPS